MQNFTVRILDYTLGIAWYQICTWPSNILVLLHLFGYRHQSVAVQHPSHKHRLSDRDVFIVISNEG